MSLDEMKQFPHMLVPNMIIYDRMLSARSKHLYVGFLYLAGQFDETNFPPSAVEAGLDELCQVTGMSKGSVIKHTHALTKRGLIAVNRGKKGCKNKYYLTDFRSVYTDEDFKWVEEVLADVTEE